MVGLIDHIVLFIPGNWLFVFMLQTLKAFVLVIVDCNLFKRVGQYFFAIFETL